MASSIRIHIGPTVYQIEASFDGGDALPAHEARTLLRRAEQGHEGGRLRAFVRSLCRSTLEWDDDVHVLDDLLRRGRLRVRPLSFKPLGESIEPPAPEVEAVENEIAETHTVEIELLDDEGHPVPGEPYRITLPDGTTRTGTLDDRGKARISGIAQAGNCQVCFHRRDAAAWDLA